MEPTWFEKIPLAMVFAGSLAIMLGALLAGRSTGRRREATEQDVSGPVGAAVGATTGLMAFLLAFTFGAAASRFDTRRNLLLDEVNAIGTCYLRAALLPEPHRSETRKLMRDYVRDRVEVPPDAQAIAGMMQRAETIHSGLWQHAVALAGGERPSPIDALFVSALNDVIDFHTKRATVALQFRIPNVIWNALFVITVLSMGALGYAFGLSGSRRFAAAVVLAVTLSSVLLLIADLDRPHQGLMAVSQQPMADLLRQMEADP